MADNGIVATGERFIPEVRDEELEIEHLERYLCIRELVRDKVVLDAACGEGYGSHILSQTAATVLGVDINRETIRHARDKYGAGGKLDYKQASVTNLSIIPTGSIEVVVSYETIEHIDGESQVKFLQEISRVLKPEGILIMSTPDKKEYSDKYKFHNQFHVKEFYIPEFVDFLHVKFQNVKLYNQYLEVASFIECPEERTEQIQFFMDRERYEASAKYIVAIASNDKLPKQSLAMAFMHLRREYMPMMDELNYCRKEAIECRKKVEKLDTCLNVNKLNREELDRRAAELDHRMNEINNRDQKIIMLNEEINNKDQVIGLLNGEIDNRNQKIVSMNEEIGQKENEVRLLIEELDRRAIELQHRMDEINNRDRKIDKQTNEMKLLKEELDRRASELDHRMNEINLRDRKIDRQQNELKLSNEELGRRARELNQRMERINELQEKINTIESLNFSGIVKWFYKKGKNK